MSLSKTPRLVLVAKNTSRQLRSNQTEAEKVFWAAVRGRRFMGLKFYRQHPLFVDRDGRETFFIADFYCHERRLVVELDGRVHGLKKNDDIDRAGFINLLGIEIIRFSNEEVEEDIARALEKLERFFRTHPPAPSLNKRRGESSPSLAKRGI